MNRIFIQIAAYRDPELLKTIEDCLKNADHPENLRFGICWQHNIDDQWDNLDEYKNDPRFNIIDVDSKKGKGTCWARHMIQHLYCEEEYTLAIDSHMRFVPGWDTKCINMIKLLQENGHEKPLLTSYVTSYDPDNDPEGREKDPWKMIFDRFIPEGAIFFLPTSMTGDELNYPIPSRFFSAHFSFTLGQFCDEVPHDHNYYFHSEEISIAARAFTHGYDLFHPNEIICYHEYTRKGRPHHWDDCNKKDGRKYDWWEVNEFCHKRNRILFGMDGEDPNQINFGEFDFGTVRSLDDYQKYSGINFAERAVTDDVINNILPTYDYQDEPDKEAIKNWCVDFYIPVEEIPDDKEFTFWYCGVHDADGNELARKDIFGKELEEILMREQDKTGYRWPIGVFSNSPPTSYSVWPMDKDGNWLDKITKDINL
jgi:hypothetical protein